MLTLEYYLKRYENPFDALRVLEKMDAGVSILDPDTLEFRYLNQKACTFLGYEKYQLLGRNFLDVVPDHQLDVWQKHRKCLDQAGHFGWMSIGLCNSEGKELPAQIKGHYAKYSGEEVLLSMLQWDNSCVEESTHGTTETFCKNVDAMMVGELDFDPEWLMDNLPLGVGVASPDGLIRYVNRVHADCLGYQPSEMLGKPNMNFIHPESAKDPQVTRNFLSVLSLGHYDWFEVDARHRDDIPVPMRARGTLEKFHNRNCVVGLFDRLG